MVGKRPHPIHSAGRVRKALALLVAVRGRPRRVVVSGPSMLPALEAGDRLLVVPVGSVRPGQVVAFTDPAGSGRTMVKRVRAVGPSGVEVAGDNEAASTDSRHFGPVRPGSLVGRAVYRYHPPDRAGWMDG